MHTKLEHLLFHSIWETYFCVCFESRNGRWKPLQSFWYTLYIITMSIYDVDSIHRLILYVIQNQVHQNVW